MTETQTVAQFTQKVIEAYSKIENPRIRVLIQSLIKHLHTYLDEVKLTESEWEFTWNFLAEMAKISLGNRNEFLLLADVLGVSQFIEMINHQRANNEVGYALIGPFYRANAPLLPYGASIVSADTPGEQTKISGKVFDIKTGKPIPNATLDVWQAAANGFYENQDPTQPDMNLRGKFQTDENGNYELVALFPTPYPVPTDGPVGQLLETAHRHPYRPAHIHFIVSALHYETLITQVFVKNGDLIDTDVVFTAGINMLGDFQKIDDQYYLNFDFQLTPGNSVLPSATLR